MACHKCRGACPWPHACASCVDVVYCSDSCRKADWERHREHCRLEEDAFKVAHECVSHPKLNRLLRGLSDEEERCLLYIECPSARTFKELVNPEQLDGVQADMAVLEIEDVRQQAKYEHSTQRAAFWSACLEQTIMYDPRTEMSLALTAVLPNDKYFAMPFIVSRRTQN